MEKRWLTVQESARYLSVSVFCVRDAIWGGSLPFVKAGKRFIIDRLDLDRWAESRKQIELAFR